MMRQRSLSRSKSTSSSTSSRGSASLMPKTTSGVRTPPPPINAILRRVGLFISFPELLAIRQRCERTRHAG